jgi:hypothetical protein
MLVYIRRYLRITTRIKTHRIGYAVSNASLTGCFNVLFIITVSVLRQLTERLYTNDVIYYYKYTIKLNCALNMFPTHLSFRESYILIIYIRTYTPQPGVVVFPITRLTMYTCTVFVDDVIRYSYVLHDGT